MKRIFSGSFSQVEDAISRSFAENITDSMKKFNMGKQILLIIFLVGLASYALYGVSIYFGSHMNGLTIALDENNEFIPIFSNIWYMHMQTLLVLIPMIVSFLYRRKNNIKVFFISNTFLTVFLFFFLLFLFKVAQLFVSNFPLRMIYSILLLGCFIFTFIRSYSNAKRMIYGTKKGRSKLVEWLSRTQKGVIGILFGIGAIYYLGKVIFPSAGDLETRLMGSLVDFFPLAICLVTFTFLYFNSIVIRSFYLNKYSEEFRNKFGVSKRDWYGEKYRK